jgi:hypothetical protein
VRLQVPLRGVASPDMPNENPQLLFLLKVKHSNRVMKRYIAPLLFSLNALALSAQEPKGPEIVLHTKPKLSWEIKGRSFHFGDKEFLEFSSMFGAGQENPVSQDPPIVLHDYPALGVGLLVESGGKILAVDFHIGSNEHPLEPGESFARLKIDTGIGRTSTQAEVTRMYGKQVSETKDTAFPIDGRLLHFSFKAQNGHVEISDIFITDSVNVSDMLLKSVLQE